SGELSIDASKDFETPVDDDMNNQYIVNLRADDGNGNQIDQIVTVSITDENEAPEFTTGTTASQNENTTVTGYDADATDPENDGLTYSIIGTGADDDDFNIDSVSGVLSFKVAPDADITGDANGNNIYEVAIRVSDGTSNVDQTVFVTVNDINEAPVMTSGGSISVIENNLTTGYVATSTDVDGDTPAYSIAGTGDDDADFGIDGVSGALSFLVAPDFETPSSLANSNVYEVDILVSDGGLTDTQTVLVTVTNENEDPTLGASGTTNVEENLLATGFTASATDPDAGATQVYALAADTPTNDNSLFQIDGGSGVLSFLAAPDFETPGSYLASNTYTVDVEVTDTLGGSDAETYFIAVTDVGEP
ncbi:MAG: cadherin, partial [Alphaproteobacteria bacterium]